MSLCWRILRSLDLACSLIDGKVRRSLPTESLYWWPNRIIRVLGLFVFRQQLNDRRLCVVIGFPIHASLCLFYVSLLDPNHSLLWSIRSSDDSALQDLNCSMNENNQILQ